MADVPPNKTIYCQNLYEKIRSTDRKYILLHFTPNATCVFCVEEVPTPEIEGLPVINKGINYQDVFCRDEEMLVRCLFAIWEDPRRGCHAQHTVERAGLGSI